MPLFNANVRPNYNVNTTVNPDYKQAPVSTPVPDANTRQKIINVLDDENRQTSAVEAERKWLEQISVADIDKRSTQTNSSRASNRIRLVSSKTATADGTGKENTGLEQISFNLTPEISESKQVIYAEIGDIRQAASILIYGGSPSRKWSVNAKFLSRTTAEADTTWKSVQLLRAWTNPDKNYKYGIDSGTPYVLRLHGYGRTWQGIPVVLTGLNIDYPTDIDYIPTTYQTNVPIIQSVSFQLTEARTPDELLEKFDLEKFKLGVLPEW